MATPERLRALAGLVGEPPDEIARTLRAEIARALSDLDDGLVDGLAADGGERALRAVHAARNSALMLDDRALLALLRALDDAIRRGDGPATGALRVRLGALWERLAGELDAAG